jgi:hypothetical protein
VIFALTYLLGIQFAPRIKEFQDKKLYPMPDMAVPVGSKNIKDLGIKQLFSESYFYLMSSFDDKKYVVCTCLIFPDYNTIETVFEGIRITREYNLINDLSQHKS